MESLYRPCVETEGVERSICARSLSVWIRNVFVSSRKQSALSTIVSHHKYSINWIKSDCASNSWNGGMRGSLSDSDWYECLIFKYAQSNGRNKWVCVFCVSIHITCENPWVYIYQFWANHLSLGCYSQRKLNNIWAEGDQEDLMLFLKKMNAKIWPRGCCVYSKKARWRFHHAWYEERARFLCSRWARKESSHWRC